MAPGPTRRLPAVRGLPTRRRRAAAALLLACLAACGGHREGASHPTSASAEAAPTRANLVVIVLDTLRRDQVALPGDASTRDDMPHLAARAARAVTMREASAPSSWTLPSMTSLLTGILPHRHGADSPEGTVGEVVARTTFAAWLSERFAYDTALLTSGPWLGRGGPAYGFQHVDLNFHLADTARQLDAWRARRTPGRPFFLVLHSFEAHDPYGPRNHPWPALPERPLPFHLLRDERDPWVLAERFLTDHETRLALLAPEAYATRREVVRCLDGLGPRPAEPERVARLRAAYEEGVRWCDELVENAIDALARRGLLENTLLVVTGDHGEAFGEHGILWHGRRLDEELVRVPLVLQGPPPFDVGRALDASVSLMDVVPTWLEWTGLPVPADLDARSFLACVERGAPGHPVTSEVRSFASWTTGGDGEVWRRSLRDGRWKVTITYDLAAGTLVEEAFNLAEDPEARHDLAEGTGILPPDLPFPGAFCRALQEVRDQVWSLATDVQARRAGRHEEGDGALRAARPAGCRHDHAAD